MNFMYLYKMSIILSITNCRIISGRDMAEKIVESELSIHDSG